MIVVADSGPLHYLIRPGFEGSEGDSTTPLLRRPWHPTASD